MYTHCPECKTEFKITVLQLRESRAISYCPACDIKFDALELLSETGLNDLDASLIKQKTSNPLGFKYKAEIAENSEPLPWEVETVTARINFLPYIAFLFFIALAIPVYLFDFNELAQNPRYRPALSSACALFSCTLPIYHQPGEVKVLQGSFHPVGDTSYQLHVVLSNQAIFQQTYPKIRLNLLTMSNKVFASRTFNYQQYLPQPPVTALFEAGATVQASIQISRPEQDIGGYTIEIL